MKPAPPDANDLPRIAKDRVEGDFDLTALAALFVLTLRQALRGRRLLFLVLLFLLPSVLAVVINLGANPPPPVQSEVVIVFILIPHGLATLTALLYGVGIVQDEVEGQTLTYLLLRPLPRWALYLTRLLAMILVTAALTAVFSVLTQVILYWGTPELWGTVVPGRVLRTAFLMGLAQAAYCSVFGALGLFTRRALLGGLAYIIAFEGALASFDFVLRRLTVMYYFRVLAIRWLDLPGAEWGIGLGTAPSAAACVLILVGVSLVFALLGCLLMMRQEFRVKTPEGS
jgi:ABC-2 type transport system permease protein